MIATPQNIIELEMLLHAYYMGDGPDVMRSEAHQEAAHRLVTHELCEWRAGKSYCLRTTEKGDFYVKYLQTVPYPVNSYKIPEQQS